MGNPFLKADKAGVINSESPIQLTPLTKILAILPLSRYPTFTTINRETTRVAPTREEIGTINGARPMGFWKSSICDDIRNFSKKQGLAISLLSKILERACGERIILRPAKARSFLR